MFIRVLVRFALVTLTVAVCACGGGSQSQPEGGGAAPASAPAPPPAPIGNSTISGMVKLEGTPPEARVIRMGSDPLCMPEGPSTSEVVVVGPGNGLQNVFVYVKDGLGDRKFPAPSTPVELDQKGCKYVPHVFGAQVGQPVKGMETTRMFDKPEIMVRFKCDVHGWMGAWGGIVAHPFFAVTKPDGSFEIKGLPAGTFTIETWHEQFGLQTQTVTVDGTAPGTAAFSYKAS
jgi:hypothetical protein